MYNIHISQLADGTKEVLAVRSKEIGTECLGIITDQKFLLCEASLSKAEEWAIVLALGLNGTVPERVVPPPSKKETLEQQLFIALAEVRREVVAQAAPPANAPEAAARKEQRDCYAANENQENSRQR